MKTQYKIWGILLFLFWAKVIHATPTPIQTITYQYSGNYKAWISYPQKTENAPVIIYNYDEYWDWAQEKQSINKGYDLRKIMQTFSNWGFICIVPIERYRKSHAITGAICYVKNIPQSNPNAIHLVGISEGACLSLLSLNTQLSVKSIILITPSTIHGYGAYSNKRALFLLNSLKCPVLYLIAAKDPNWKIKQTNEFYTLLKDSQTTVVYKEYPESHMWFWDPNNAFMMDIYQFIFQIKPPIQKVL